MRGRAFVWGSAAACLDDGRRCRCRRPERRKCVALMQCFRQAIDVREAGSSVGFCRQRTDERAPLLSPLQRLQPVADGWRIHADCQQAVLEPLRTSLGRATAMRGGAIVWLCRRGVSRATDRCITVWTGAVDPLTTPHSMKSGRPNRRPMNFFRVQAYLHSILAFALASPCSVLCASAQLESPG